MKIYVDNSDAIATAKYGNFTKISKHIEVQYHYINENYKNKRIDIVKMGTTSNVTEMLTKSLDKTTIFEKQVTLKIDLVV